METCGGPWDQFGRCEVGLACVRNPGDTTQQAGYCRTIRELLLLLFRGVKIVISVIPDNLII